MKSFFLMFNGAYPLNDCEAASKGVDLTVDQELLSSLRWLHIVKTTDGGAFVCNILAVCEQITCYVPGDLQKINPDSNTKTYNCRFELYFS